VGTSSAAMTVAAKVNGDTITKQLQVTINKDQRKLLAAETGVAFSSTPSWSRLSRTIKISDNFGLDGAWSASSNKSWLSVTASGRTAGGAGTLSLSANPASLPLNQISYATVTLSSTEDGVTAPETIQVALWKGSVTPTAQAKAALHYTTLVADPIRPLVYVHDSASSLDVYNIYTGAKVATIASLGASLAGMTVSPNGDTLYVFDTANRTIVLLDLATLSKTGSWAMPVMATASSRMVAMHPNGVNVVLTNGNGSFLAPTGALLGASFSTGEMAASGDGRRLFSDGGSAYSIDFTAINGGTLLASRYATLYSGSSGDIASNLDGSRFYTTGNYTSRCSIMSGDNASQIGNLPGGDNSYYPINVEVASDGRVFCGNSNYYGVADVWVHRADGTLQTTFKLSGTGRTLLARQMVISGDALMVAGLTDEPSLVFTPVGP
ncbi:MAG: quinoprotein amine dehydrogenase, partial [Massilia sp.]